MSSNPFRRKVNEGTPSASGRTSFDVNVNEERLQQVAQQAFAVEDYEIVKAGTSGLEATKTQSPAPAAEESTTGTMTAVTTAIELQSFKLEDQDVAEQQRIGPPPSDMRSEGNGGRRSLETHTTPPSSISSAAPIRSPNARSAKPPAPPPSRSAAPPAPPRPRRSVRRPRNDVSEKDSARQENVVSLKVVPASPTGDDPFAESTISRSITGQENESNVEQQSREPATLQATEQNEAESSEYEEVSDVEVVEPPAKSSSSSFVLGPVTAEPESMDTSLAQPPNPFRKKDENEGQVNLPSSEIEEQENNPPPIRFGIQRSNSSQNNKAFRQSMDVDAFKHLMLTGQTVHTPDSTTTTETDNMSKQSLSESAEQAYTPRSSQDTGRSGYEPEEADIAKVATSVSPSPKAKPPPPKPRGQRNSMMGPPPRPESQTANVSQESGEAVVLLEPTSSPPRPAKPPVPQSRRISAQVMTTPEGAISFHSVSSSPAPAPAPPPPPPSRRLGPSPKTQPTTPPATIDEQPPPLNLLSSSSASVRKPEPPPARRSSKRLSAAPSRLQAFAEAASGESSPGKGVPPPPPTRKKSYLSQSTTGTDPSVEPQPRVSSSFDILDDLSKLQKEVDQLMGKV